MNAPKHLVGDWEETGTRLDSGLYFAGTDFLTATGGFMPMIMYNKGGRPTLDAGYFGRDEIESILPLKWFTDYAAQGLYDNCRTLRLFRGRDTAGFLVPLSPVSRERAAIFFTAKHIAGPGPLRCTTDIYAKLLSIDKGQLRSVRPLVTALPPDINGYSLKKASFPSQNLENDWSNADLAALYTDHSSADLPFWFVPCATVPQPGQAVTVLGHGGQASMPWAARFLATEVDEANGDLDVNGNLDANAALQRLTDLRNVAIHEDNLTASPGTVHAFDGNTHETVEHTCSVFPGLSGGAGVDMAEPWKVMFYHLQSQRGTKCKYSWGVSVLHPVHAFMYLTHVLPRLTTLERKDFILKREPKGPTASTQSTVVDLYPLIIEYITLFQSKWVQWGVQDNVHAFKEKHPTYSPQEVLGTSS